MKQMLIVCAAVLLLIACSSEERLVNNTDVKYKFLTLSETDPTVLPLREYPGGELISEDIISSFSSLSIEKPIKRIREYGNRLYIVVPESNKIYIIETNGYSPVEVLDFSEDALEPSDICFPNATTAYISFGNDNKVKVLDLTNYEIAGTITVSGTPYAITACGNQLFTANRQDNTVSVIDTRTNKEENVIMVGEAPAYIEASTDKLRCLVVCLGGGRVDSAARTAASLRVIDATSSTVEYQTGIGGGSLDPLLLNVIGIAVPNERWAFIMTDEYLMRIDFVAGSQLQVINRSMYKYLKYDYKKDKLLMIGKIGLDDYLIISNSMTSVKERNYKISEDVIEVFPL